MAPVRRGRIEKVPNARISGKKSGKGPQRFFLLLEQLRARAATATYVVLLLGLSCTWPARGAEPAGTPLACRIGVNVEDLYDLNMAADTFGAILWIWSLCPRSDVQPLNTIAFPTAAAGLGIGQSEVTDLPSGEQYSSQRVQGTFRYNWEMNDYPFDQQRVVILMDETSYGAERLVFQADTQESFLTPDIRDRLDDWTISDLTLATLISDEASTYGMPNVSGSRYAELEVSFTMKRTQVITFLKLTSGVYAAAFIAFLSFFYDPNDRGAFGGKLGLLVGVLFAVLINMRSADSTIGDIGDLTLVTKIHLLTLLLIIALAIITLRDRRCSERGLHLRHPDWPTLAVAGSVYTIALAAMIIRAAQYY